MKLKKCMKRISAIILAATMVVVALPNQPIVKADDTDVPDEILFPINILDFPADNLFFECPMNWMEGYDSYLDLTSQNIAGVNDGGEAGKKLVADKLETDKTSIYYGLPVYKEKTVDYIASRVKATIENAKSKNLAFNKPIVDRNRNSICATNYIHRSDEEWVILDASDTYYETDYKNGNANKYGLNYYVTLGGQAINANALNCFKDNYIGYIGGDITKDDLSNHGKVTFTYNNTKGAGTYAMFVYYMTNEDRNFVIKVNGADIPASPNPINFPSNGTWDNPRDKSRSFLITLKSGINKIEFSGDGTYYAPNLDRIEIGPQKYYGIDEVVDDITVEAEGNKATFYDPNWYNTWHGDFNGYTGRNTDGKSVHIGHYNSEYSITFDAVKAGKYDVDIYYSSYRTGDYSYSLNINNNNTSQTGFRYKTNMSVAPATITGVNLKAGSNTIKISGWFNTNVDKFVFRYVPDSFDNATGTVPLGNYKDSKEKYNIDRDGNKVSDYGFFDIATCYDYAYFMTANLYKNHPSINAAYNKYTNLVFHKVNQDGKNYYEFMGDQIHNESISQGDYNSKIGDVYDKLGSAATTAEKEADLDKYNAVKKGIGRLIYNPETRMIRNACDAEGNYVGPSGSEYETNSGFMFVCDGDEYNKDSANYDAGYGIKKYPNLDPSKNGDDNKKHNFNYTIRTHSRFVYKEGTGQQFFFSGDDDVYVFVNGNLIVDLGGQHQQLNGSINLDTLAEQPGNPYGLIADKAVDFDFFYIERHSTASNFWGKMSFQLRNDEVALKWPTEPDNIAGMTDTKIPYGFTIDLNYQFSSLRDLSTSKDITFRDDIGNYIGADKFELSDQVKIGNKYKVKETDDSGNEKIVVKEDSTKYHMSAIVHRMQPDETYIDEVYDFQFNNPVIVTDEEKKAVMDFFKELSLEQGDMVEISGIMYDTSKKKFEEFDETDKASVRRLSYKVYVDYMTYMTMGGTNSIEDTDGFKQTIDSDVVAKVVIGSLTITCSLDDENLGEEYDTKEDFSLFGNFKLLRIDSEDDKSTTDVDERVIFENTVNLRNSGSIIIFDAEPHPELKKTLDDGTVINPIEPGPIPKGSYDLMLETDKLTGYELVTEVWVGGELKVVVSRSPNDNSDDFKVEVKDPDYIKKYTADYREKLAKELFGDNPEEYEAYLARINELDNEGFLKELFSHNKFRLLIEPSLNLEEEEWIYPPVEYKLKAYRTVNPLKDLT
ncbi:MAG: fibro-slime domain-containing protein [Lachnospiraceae bacterium]|nr:fibro-slime domain-containing protein [Lachnospiraceae bacterium]